jgi:uncharacterized membrane protein YphA (DoxX/SURF4 family)
MLAVMFANGGLDAVALHPESKAAKAEPVITPIAAESGASDEPTTWVRVNGIAQVTAGLRLAVGKLPRLSAVVLASAFVPTTLAGHRFWEEDDPAKRSGQTISFSEGRVDAWRAAARRSRHRGTTLGVVAPATSCRARERSDPRGSLAVHCRLTVARDPAGQLRRVERNEAPPTNGGASSREVQRFVQ